jgi:plasmid replication initiation protein
LPAQKEIAKNTDISFTFEEIKTGRRIEKIKFYINTKKIKKNPPTEQKIDEKTFVNPLNQKTKD